MSKLSTSLFALMLAASASAMVVTQTTDGPTLGAALGGGGGLLITSVTVMNGNVAQFGTYTGFTTGPVTIGDGVVMSTGFAVNTPGPASAGNSPNDNAGASGTAEFNAYGPGHITNFSDSNDVASILVVFTLTSASQVGFDFIFGSIEYPDFTSDFTDAFLAFLDGTAVTDQIVFDGSNNAVQVGNTFAGALTTADTNSTFADPHGLVRLQTFTVNPLSAGVHTIRFEVGDVNDHILDSGVFIANLHAGEGPGGTTGTSAVPEPGSVAMVGIGVAGLIWARRRKRAA